MPAGRWVVFDTNVYVAARRHQALRLESDLWGTDKGYGLALVAPVYAEVLPIHRDDTVMRVQLTHANEAEVGEVRLPVGEPLGEPLELGQVVAAIEREDDQPVPEHREHPGTPIPFTGERSPCGTRGPGRRAPNRPGA